MAVLDKLFYNQLARRLNLKSHSVRCHDDVYKLYKSYHLSKATRGTYQCLLKVIIALMKAMRPSELHRLLISQFTKMTQGYTRAWRIFGTIITIYGMSKNF